MTISISVYTKISTSTSISISISIPFYSCIYIYTYTYAYVYLSKMFALSSRWYSNPKPPLNQARIYSTPALYKDFLNQHDDNIQGNYCGLLCLNLPSTCFQGACRVVYKPWASHSTQHLACDNRCFKCALGGRAQRSASPPISPPSFLFKPKNLHTKKMLSIYTAFIPKQAVNNQVHAYTSTKLLLFVCACCIPKKKKTFSNPKQTLRKP